MIQDTSWYGPGACTEVYHPSRTGATAPRHACPASYCSPAAAHAADICRACAKAFEACAAECEKYDDEVMQRCAVAFRRCAEECRKIAA